MSKEKFDSKGEIELIRVENAVRDKIALQALIRVAAVERLLLDSGTVSDQDIAKSITLVTAEVVEDIKKATGQISSN